MTRWIFYGFAVLLSFAGVMLALAAAVAFINYLF